MHAHRLLLIAIVIAAAACTPQRRRHTSDDGAVPTPPAEKIATADALIHHAVTLRADQHIATITLGYVHSDGTLDPTYGTATIEYSLPPGPPPPPDDPKRPLGAPDPNPPADPLGALISTHCPELSWSAGTVGTRDEAMCAMTGALPPLHCTVAAIWTRAIAAGAPREALATIRIDSMALLGEPPRWSFSISDRARNFNFDQSFPDDCQAVVEAPNH